MQHISTSAAEIIKDHSLCGHNPYNYLYRYFPKYAMPDDVESNRLRLFKCSIRNAMKHYYYCLQNWINARIEVDTCIVAVPSSDMNHTNAITKVAKSIAINNPKITDATHALKKAYSTESFCKSGKRNTSDLINSMSIDHSLIAGKHILVVDDITTTGKTFAAIEQLMFDAGALSVLCVSLGKTVKLKNLIP